MIGDVPIKYGDLPPVSGTAIDGAGGFLEQIIILTKQRDEALAALPDAEKLDILAEWVDLKDAESGSTSTEVQHALREWAAKARIVLTRAKDWE